jgi:hypothetical protein
MGIRSLGQQGIVFAVFAALFAVFALILPGFLTTANMLTLNSPTTSVIADTIRFDHNML